MSLLAAKQLSIGYGTKVLASGIDLTLQAGTLTCLLGPNGVGKSTLFKSLMGFLPLLEGDLKLDGQDHSTLSRQAYAQLIAYVPQAQPQPFAHRVLDLVLMGRTHHLGLFGSPGRHDIEVARHALNALGVLHLQDHEITRISGGQMQLALIARALAQQARILVMDEPTASLDLGNASLVLAQIRQLAARGLGVLMSTHDPAQAFAHADQVVLMGHEAQCVVGHPAEVMTEDRLSQIYGLCLRIEATKSGRRVIVPSDAGG